MAEIATIARPYAEALFQASKANLAGTQAWLNSFAAVASDAALLEFAGNPKATNAQIIELGCESAAKQCLFQFLGSDC
jgi:F-type H+-transporting ATPase subunit delta